MPRFDSKARAHAVIGLLALVLSVFYSDPGRAQSSGGAHPDFSGIWFPAGFAKRTPNPLPFTEEASKLAKAYAANFKVDDDPGRFCIWPGMPRAVWGAPFSVEVIQRPQDVTIYWEGYGMYRKIYMADHHPPKALLPSAMGHAVAHWEGDTLAIETTDLKPYPYMTRLPNSSYAHVSERMKMEEREEDGERHKYLIDDITLTDPKVYTQPVHLHAEAVFRPDLHIIEYTCTNILWEDYLQSRGLTLPDLDALPESSRGSSPSGSSESSPADRSEVASTGKSQSH